MRAALYLRSDYYGACDIVIVMKLINSRVNDSNHYCPQKETTAVLFSADFFSANTVTHELLYLT